MAIFGPLNGTNNAVSSSAHFGVVGRIVGSFLSLLTAIAFFSISVWSSGDAVVGAAHALFGVNESEGLFAAAYGVFAVTQVLLAARQGLFLHFFISVPRYVMVIFPCYFAFATLLAPRRSLQVTWILLSAASLFVDAALYGAWRFLG